MYLPTYLVDLVSETGPASPWSGVVCVLRASLLPPAIGC